VKVVITSLMHAVEWWINTWPLICNDFCIFAFIEKTYIAWLLSGMDKSDISCNLKLMDPL